MARAIDNRNWAQSHVHERRRFFGEDEAAALLEWMNSKERRKDDKIELLLRAASNLREGHNGFQAMQTIRRIINHARLKLVPFWSVPLSGDVPHRKLLRNRWDVVWDPMARGMSRAQSLALHAVIQLASNATLERVRQCERGDCGLWYFARFRTQRFHSEKCQQAAFRSDPEWKASRAAYMRRLRHSEKLRYGGKR